MAESKVSLRGLKCPLPALKTRKLLLRMAAGDILVIECTDPLTMIDIPNLLRETGDQLKHSERNDGVLIFKIQKNAGGSDARAHPMKPTPRKPSRKRR